MEFKVNENAGKVSSYKIYQGAAPVKIVAVNPTAEELQTILGRERNVNPYITDNNGVKRIRLDFWFRTDAEKCGFDIISSFSIFCEDRPMLNSAGTKYKIVDKYGRTAWGTVEEVKAGQVPMYVNKTSNTSFAAGISTGYHIMRPGEENLLALFRNLFCIGRPDKWNETTNRYELRSDCDNYVLNFTNIKDWFTGDISEIREAIKVKNNVGVVLSKRDGAEGKMFQTAYNRGFYWDAAPFGVRHFTLNALEKDLKAQDNNEEYLNSRNELDFAKELVVEPSAAPEPAPMKMPEPTLAEDDLPF